MSLKKRLEGKSAGIGSQGSEAPAAASPVDRTVRTAPGQMLAFRGMLQESDAEIERLRSEVAKALPSELPLAELREVLGRRRKLSDEDFEALKENLRQHPLVTPVTVRSLKEGGYEIVSGHNRVAALRELGRTTIRVSIMESSDAQADLNAFYANLLHPSLPDFSKFMGFRKRIQETGRTQKDVASEAGVKESTMSRWMSFAGLPDDVLQVIAQAPERLGGATAAELVRKLPTVGEAAVRQAVEAIVFRGASQDKAIQALTANRAPNEAGDRTKVPPLIVKRGKFTYCTIRAKDGMLQLNFANPIDRENLTEELVALVRNSVKSLE